MKNNRFRTIYTVVGAFVLLVITYLPLLFVLSNSLKSTAQFAENPFSLFTSFHFNNYVAAWNGVYLYLKNTIIVAFLSILVGIPSSAAAAYGFSHWKFRGQKVLFGAYLGLLMIPWVLTLIPMFLEMKTFGLFNTWWALVFTYASADMPLMVFLMRTFFENIPKDLIESGRIDGCSEGGILLRIVMPLSIPALITGVILMCFNIWGDYIWPEILLPNSHLLTISSGLQLYVSNFLSGTGLGPLFAAYVISMAPIMLLIAVAMKYFVRGVTGGALKG